MRPCAYSHIYQTFLPFLVDVELYHSLLNLNNERLKRDQNKVEKEVFLMNEYKSNTMEGWVGIFLLQEQVIKTYSIFLPLIYFQSMAKNNW